MKLRSLFAGLCLTVISATAYAQGYQSLYSVKGNKVTYDGKVIQHADSKTFIIMEHGYAKDAHNVYLDGHILRFVDPLTFRLTGSFDSNGPGNAETGRPGYSVDLNVTMGQGHGHGQNNYDRDGYYYYHNDRVPSYMVSTFDVFFAGQKVQGATASTFKDLGEGYGRDAFNAYYFGQKIPQSSGNTFAVIGGGYSKDAFRVYYEGKAIPNSSGNSFKFMAYGYAKDAFNVYYHGVKVEGANPNTFKVDKEGYARDAFNTYYFGRKIQ